MREDRSQEKGGDKRGRVRLEIEGRPRTGGASSSDPRGREDRQVEKWLQAGVITPRPPCMYGEGNGECGESLGLPLRRTEVGKQQTDDGRTPSRPVVLATTCRGRLFFPGHFAAPPWERSHWMVRLLLGQSPAG